ncbi:MAG: response regulator [Candidatus Omnitrophica bacterium]|nr:response regulator [Candidatus Omnitrophota bacterium]
MNILAIDDETEVLECLKDILTSDGHTVSVAHDVREGLELVTGNTDIIITDLRMQKLDGEDYIEIIKVRYPNMPIIVLSGYIDSVEELEKIGAKKVLSKPLDVKQLLEAVNAFKNELK